MAIEEDEDDDDAMIITSKLQLVLTAKSRRLQYTSSPIISHHVSLSLSSSPDDSSSQSRASVPFSWEEEPGKPKQQRLRHPSYSKCLKLPPRLFLPPEFPKLPPLPAHHHRLARLKRWFRWRKERALDDDVAEKVRFFFPSEDEDDMKTTRRGLHCLSHVTRCCFGVK
ncbi:hypothetical protein V5N11_019897 [Cardamine amara subsp. amara]|uniref:Uncharacterized protein n=1 Tax=Cardamine amara subsp. amara TaxID=228776 RepID=A0ABD1AIL1_CARAN